jgi:hypothetical protein
MTKISEAQTYGLTLRESATDGSDFANAPTDYQRVFLGEDGALHLKDAAGDVTPVGASSVATDPVWDAKGDLIIATGADAASRLAVAANGASLVSASGATHGVTWQLNKLDATAPPGVGDDANDGYTVGSIWIDVTGDDAFICVDATAGAAVWNPFEAAGEAGASAVVSGGTETTDATYQYNLFTDSGTLTIDTPGAADVLVVGGGGGGGGYYSGGGGGGGGVAYVEGYPLTGATVAVVVGAGGTAGLGSAGYYHGGRGKDSALGPLGAVGGGGGGGAGDYTDAAAGVGHIGGSGGGGGQRNSAAGGLSLSTQGYAGGISRTGNTSATGAGGGGGGASAVGSAPGASDNGAAGGDGRTIAAFASFGSSGVFSGGGGGGGVAGGGAGGTGGGGHGGATSANTGMTAGPANTGGGGGGGGNTSTTGAAGGDGGSGVVIIRTLL